MRNYIFGVGLILTCIVWSEKYLSAQEISSVSVTENFTNVSLPEALLILREKYKISIYYKEEWIDDKPVNKKFENASLQYVLDKLFESNGLLYVIIQDNVVLMPRKEVALIMGELANQNLEKGSSNQIVIGDISKIGKYKNVKITGTVTDGKNGESLIGATVMIEDENAFSVTGYNGEYTLELKPGIYNLTVSSIGFEDKHLQINAVSPGRLDLELFEKSHAIDEIVVKAEQADRNVHSYQMSIIEFDAKSIKQLPSLVGERDVIKSFTMMPGVKSIGEFGSGINVRGGGEDQNLYLLEGAPIFNTSHVMGLLSVVNPDVVNSATLYKGHIPAEYGERVSSVMDIKFKDHNYERFQTKGGIGLFSSRLMFEGPLFDNKVTFKVGGRTSYSDYLLKQLPDYYLQNSSASFYDLTGLVNISIKNNPISVYAYMSYDYFKYAQNLSYYYSNKIGSFSWSHIFNSNFSSNVNIAYSNYELTKDDFMDVLYANRVESEIDYLSGKLKFEYTSLEKHSVEFGAQGIQYQLFPGERIPLDNSLSEYFTTNSEKGFEFSAFINDIFEVNQRITLQMGLRYTSYYLIGPKTVYNYNEQTGRTDENYSDSINYGAGEVVANYMGIEPRFSIKYALNETSSLKLSYNKNQQYLSLLSYTSISTPEDVWKLADPYIKPIIANQLALGYYRNFFNNGIETSVEVYYKRLENAIEYKNGAKLNLNNNVERELVDATGTNYGIEFLLRKNTGKINGWITYTYSRALKQTNGVIQTEMINRNEIYPSQFDKPHDLTIFVNYKHNRRLRFGTNFSYSSGRSITLPEYIFKAGTNELVYYSDRNKYRLPAYHRLDLSISLDESLKKSKKWKGSWTLSILNVYGRKNAYSVFYRKEEPTIENNYEVFSLYKLYLIGIPMPTLTYNFIF